MSMSKIAHRVAGCGHICNGIAILIAVIFASLTASELNSGHDAGRLQVYEHNDEPWCHMIDQDTNMLVNEMFGQEFKLADKLQIAKVAFNKKECDIQPASREAWKLQGWEKGDFLDWGQRNFAAAIFMFTVIKVAKASAAVWSYLHPEENMMTKMISRLRKDSNEDTGTFCVEVCCGLPALAAFQFLLGWMGNMLISPIITMRLDENAKNIIYMKFSYYLWWYSTWASFSLIAWPGFCFCIYMCFFCYYGEQVNDLRAGQCVLGVLFLGVIAAGITVTIMCGMYIANIGFAFILAVDFRLVFNFSIPGGIILYAAMTASAVAVNLFLDVFEFCYTMYEIFAHAKGAQGSSQEGEQGSGGASA